MTRYAIMEVYGPQDPEFAVHKVEAENERDALAQFAISQGYADPRQFDDTEEQYIYEAPPSGQTIMVYENTELTAVPA